MREIATSVEIKAPPEVVWDVLTDFAGYAQWNPFIREAAGQARAGERLMLRMYPAGGGRPITFRPTVRVAAKGMELRWVGRLFVPGVFDGEHRFVMAFHDGVTRVQQAETFSGLLVPFLGKTIDSTLESFRLLDEALKTRAEASSPA
ncbi:SRPBCC domain-containing protein [Jiangella gansuensis]|uniref:SRPBCC domain-containing protein n=1 Tax=Jiangella gansuensis TaxID=281473 RepID=UPI00047BB9E6|nr:SRPBCC domain-containing protein [Jiangella gansuensis]